MLEFDPYARPHIARSTAWRSATDGSHVASRFPPQPVKAATWTPASVAILAATVVLIGVTSWRSRTVETRPAITVPQATGALSAGANCYGNTVSVYNREPHNWSDVKIAVNGEYSFSTDVLYGNDAGVYADRSFAKRDGTPLDLTSVACKSIDVQATVNGTVRRWSQAIDR